MSIINPLSFAVASVIIKNFGETSPVNQRGGSANLNNIYGNGKEFIRILLELFARAMRIKRYRCDSQFIKTRVPKL